MTTMRVLVQDAFEEIGVKKAEIALTPDELQSGIRRANDLLTSWADIGYIVGYNPVFNGDDIVEIDTSALGAAKYNLATRLAPSYQKAVSIELATIAADTFATLINSNIFIGEVAYPDTLPLGSGNQGCNTNTDARFFNSNKKENF